MELLNGAGWDVGGGGAHGFVRDIDAVYLNPGRAAETSTKGNRRIASFGRVEVLAVLNLHSRLELSEVKKVTAINRQVLNLVRGENSLHRGLFRVHLNFGTLHLNRFVSLAYLQFHIAICSVAHLYDKWHLRGLKSAGLYFHHVVTGYQGARDVSPS